MLRRICARPGECGQLKLTQSVHESDRLEDILSGVEFRTRELEVESYPGLGPSFGPPSSTASPSPGSRSDTRSLNNFQRNSVLRRGNTSFAPWLGGDYFLCVEVKEGVDFEPGTTKARTVPGVNMIGNLVVRPTCDPFVRVTLQHTGSASRDSSPLAEAETRVVYRNRHPKWEECLPFPLDDVTEDTSILLRVYDKDIGHFNSFVGQVSLPIPSVLSSIPDLGQEVVYRLPLQDRTGAAKKRAGGELMFGVSILEKQQYHEMMAVIKGIQDPDKIHSKLGSYRLHLKIHSVRGLIGKDSFRDLAMEVKLCCFEARIPLRSAMVEGEISPDDLELAIPLGAAFQEGGAIKGKDRLQFGDVRIDLYAGKGRLAKTQVPIWDVPFKGEGGPPTPPPPSPGPARRSDESVDTPKGTEPSDASTGLLSQIANLASSIGGPSATSTKPEQPQLREGLTGLSASSAFATAPPSPPPAAPPSPPRPLWEGKRYIRKMEKFGALASCPELVVSMQLVKVDETASADNSVGGGARSAGGGGGGGGLDWAAADEEAAEALAAPMPWDTTVGDFTIPAGPQCVCRSLYASDAEVWDRICKAEGLTNVNFGPWTPDPDGKALAVRQASYHKPTPVGPTPVTVVMRILSKGPGGFVMHNTVTPTVPPVGQCVNVQMQLVATHAGPGKTRFVASCKTEWFKSGMMVNVLKGKVESALPGDARKHFQILERELARQLSGGSGSGSGGVGGSGASFDSGTAAASGGGVIGGGGALGAGDGGSRPSGFLDVLTSPPGLLLCVSWAIALVAVLCVLRVSSQLAGNNRAISQLAAAVAAASERMAAAAAAMAAAGQQCQATAAAAAAGR
ncbi:hypothetical protein HYH03_011101 [Edaphochlamys debaryana]|uniref:C2 domain-containing protein n=1 Tax=Edaphochlamys debaryana TaxID=47281 RepID=A0A835XUP7_9CHLO|nr:hypothetical protein HYH03_011101 [Edaphochlamys debaryana]|eukprot:KAG2490471.1 hypothetical protein HYH03_011101 [Edaphochlamys debaryana]